MTEYERRSSLVKVKVQVVPLHVIKRVGEEVELQSFLASAVSVNACSALRPSDWSRSGHFGEKSYVLALHRTSIVQTAAIPPVPVTGT